MCTAVSSAFSESKLQYYRWS